MAAGWIEKITGSLEDKKQYRQYKERVRALPAPYRTAAEALDRYLMIAGGVSDGGTLVRMLDDLVTLFEAAAADGTPVRAIVGENPVEFVDDFLSNYAEAQWIRKERARLIEQIDRAAESDGAS
ncbi:DUF1048 domain-containing protein [Microbacterium sp. W1N]|uniref:DUF1048 domain-containing protein n=1 Tax=Microbacterium festucae TaxID=2977531 RepID=UPI0021BE8B4A|nr:DUF1048 domain-containing protein [Microbacterium festucae]MCT9819392.1 DUF1048 domain-containing protein [Microbacterium festucae]